MDIYNEKNMGLTFEYKTLKNNIKYILSICSNVIYKFYFHWFVLPIEKISPAQ